MTDRDPYVSRQSPNSRGRKRTAQGPRGIQAGDRREIRPAILYHKFGRQGCQIYPFEEWERIEQKLAGLSNFNPTKKKFLDRVNYWGQQVEMDGQGRLLIPQLLRDAAEIKGEVAVIGNLNRLLVRNLEAYRKEIEEQAFTPDDEKTLDELGI